MNGSAPPPAGKLERGTTAAEICVFIPQEAGVAILVRAAAARSRPAEPGQRTRAEHAARVVWRRRAGGTPVVHAYRRERLRRRPALRLVPRRRGPSRSSRRRPRTSARTAGAGSAWPPSGGAR